METTRTERRGTLTREGADVGPGCRPSDQALGSRRNAEELAELRPDL